MRGLRGVVALVMLTTGAAVPGALAQPVAVDVLLRGGRVVDGTGAAARVTDVGLREIGRASCRERV